MPPQAWAWQWRPASPRANTLEALSAAYLLRRFTRFRESLDRPQDILEFVVLVAAVCHRPGVQGLKGLDWFEVTEVRGLVKDGQVSQFQVKLKVGFRILSGDELRGA